MAGVPTRQASRLEVVETMITDAVLIREWRSFAYSVGTPNASLHELEIALITGLKSYKDIFFNILQIWNSGGQRTIGELCSFLECNKTKMISGSHDKYI
jgi:hypothetical protein